MAKPELGTKRLCSNCGAKFYDLSKTPIVCPKCETVFTIVTPVTRGRPDAAAAAAATAAAAAAAAAAARGTEADAETPETQDAEFVSLEDADAEATGKKSVDGEDDIELEGDEATDDTLIEETEEGDDDVTDIIGDGHEDEEET